MSGLEIIGLVVGLLPLTAAAVKAYSATGRKMSSYRHYSPEVRRLQMMLQVHQQNFLNECQLLLQLVVEDGQSQEDMLNNSDHAFWNDERLADKLIQRLSGTHDPCKYIIEEARSCLEELGKELECFDILLAHKRKDEPLKDTIRRIKGSVRIPFKKPEFEKKLKKLRDLNSDLSLQRSYVSLFQGSKPTSYRPPTEGKTLPKQYDAVRNAAQTLHTALMTAWCCTDPSHTGHCAKLCVETQSDQRERVCLDLAISYSKGLQHAQIGSVDSEPPIWLFVRSATGESASLGKQEQRRPLTSAIPSTVPPMHDALLEKAEHNRPATSSLDGPAERQAKRRKLGVRFANDEIGTDIISETQTHEVTMDEEPEAAPNLDLQVAECVCRHFKQRACPNSDDPDHDHHVVGYLETPRQRKHIFYCPGSREIPGRQSLRSVSNPIYSLSEFLSRVPEDEIEVDDRLRLAHHLSKGILQFHSTPWLDDEWHIDNISLFGSPDEASQHVLRTLHFNVCIPNRRRRLAPDTPDDAVERPASSSISYNSPAHLLYGIRSMVLFSLGVALLEIGQWKPLQLTGDDDPVVVVRKMARAPMKLGSRYREIVRKCLECDFGYGNDLNASDLKNAVYGGVTCQLEEMFKRLSI